MAHDRLPPDPFEGFESGSESEFGFETEFHPPLDDEERAQLLSDLTDLALYQDLLEPRGVRGIAVECGDCNEVHFHDWELLRSGLEQLLFDGNMRPHEPAYDPNPSDYVTWDYCRGYADGVIENQRAH